MSLVGNIDIGVGLDTSVFKKEVADVAKDLRETFSLDSRQANSVARLEVSLRQQAETWGMTADEIKLYRMAQQGVPASALATAKALQAQIQKLKEVDKEQEEARRSAVQMAQSGKATYDSTRKAAERYRHSVAELKGQLQAGVISQKTFNRAMKALPDSPLKRWGPTLKNVGIGFLGITTAALGTATALSIFTKRTILAFDETGDLADRLGVNITELQSMQHAAMLGGDHVEDMGMALAKLNKNLSEAARGSGPAVGAFKALGLNANALSKMAPTEVFKAISAAFVNIKNPADKASIAMDIFGKSGQNIINTLNAGPQKLAEWQKEAKDLGIALTAADQDIAGAFDDTLDRITLAFKGLATKIMLEFAPVVIALGDRFLAWSKDTVASGETVNTVFTQTRDVIAGIATVFSVVSGTWKLTQALLTGGLGKLIEYVGQFGIAIEKVINLIPGVHVSFGTTTLAIGRDLQKLATEQGNAGLKAFGSGSGENVTAFFDDIRSGAKAAGQEINRAKAEMAKFNEESNGMVEQVQTLRDELTKKISQIGLTDAQKQIADLRKAGASPKQLAEVEALQRQFDTLTKAQEHLKQLKSEAQSLTDSLMTPLQKYQANFKKLVESLRAGVLSQKDFNSAVTALNQSRAKEISDQRKGILDKFSTPLEKYKSELMELGKAFKEGVISQAEFAKGSAKLKEDMGKSVLDKIATPLEKYRKEIKDIKDLETAGVITSAQSLKAQRATKKEFGFDNTPKLTGALDVGSQEARSAILRFNLGSADTTTRIAREAASQTGIQKAMLTELQKQNNKKEKKDTLVI